MPTLPFPPKELLPLIPLRFRERGQRYFLDGRVLTLKYEAATHKIRAEVVGTMQRHYQVMVHLRTHTDGRPAMDNYCTCPVSKDCKHVAAVLFQAQEQWGRQTTPDGLPVHLARWVQQASNLPATGVEADPRCLLYLLDPGRNGSPPRVHTVTVRRLKKGGYGKPRLFDPTSLARPGYLETSDLHALSWLRMVEAGDGDQGIPLTPREGAETLRALLATGRLHLLTPGMTPGIGLALGEPCSGRFEWLRGEDGVSRVVLHAETAELRPLTLAPPWYLDPQEGLCGPLETGLDAETAWLLASAPPIPAEALEPLRKALHRGAPQAAAHLPLPKPLKHKRKRGVRPIPLLRLESIDLAEGLPGEPDWLELALLSFDYDGIEIDPGDETPTVRKVENGAILDMERRFQDEERALDLLYRLGLTPWMDQEEGALILYTPAVDDDQPHFWLAFMEEAAPELRKKGWRVEPLPGFRFDLVEPADWDAQLEENPDNHWFDLSLGIELETPEGRERVELLPLVVEALEHLPARLDAAELEHLAERDVRLPLHLEDGRILLMPLRRLAPILGILVELFDQGVLTSDGHIPIAPTQGGQLAELEEAIPDIRWQGGEALRAWGRRLRDFKGIRAVPPPKGLHTKLRPYQRQGLDWLQFLREYDLGGVLADDMGLGKTIQALAHLLVEKEAGRTDRPSLVVAPTSLMFNWRREAERFAPDLRVLVSHGPQRKARFAEIPDHDLVLTTYPLLSRDAEALRTHPYHLLVLDEAQAVKNPRSKAAQAVRKFQARHRLALTGTPMENHLGELWALMDFLMPGLLGDERRFRRVFRNPIEKAGDGAVQEQLRRRVRPFLLRRTKEEVAAELPPKTEILRETALAPDQLELYEALRLAMHERVRAEVAKKGIARSGIVILDALLKLRQVCCDPRLVKLDSARKVKGSAKLDLLMDLLPELIEEGRRVLLFSQFTSMLSLIEAEVKKRRIGFVKLTGQTRKREAAVERFQKGEVPLFLISLKAGGSGLNLTAADCVIHYDPWWNPAAERQATDRAHRIGQEKPVFVYKLLTEGTVEQRVAELQARKQALADAVLEGGGAALGRLEEADIDALFAPVET